MLWSLKGANKQLHGQTGGQDTRFTSASLMPDSASWFSSASCQPWPGQIMKLASVELDA